VAHEFNDLLAVILMNTELALMKLPSDSLARRHLEAIARTTNFASKVVGKLLTFSRRQLVRPQVISLDNAIVEMDKMLRPIIGEKIEVVTLPDQDLGQIRMDRSQIEQVLVNLIVNARDAMPRGGKLTIRATNVTIDEGYARRHSNATPGEYVMLAVSDTGVGMDEEIKARLFEPFFTTKETGKGTGLGLATCYGIVQQSGGWFEVHSEPAKGTTFKIYLPRVKDEAEAMAKHDESWHLPGGTETVLVVEDEPSVRNLVARTLQTQGYMVLEAANGEEGLRVAQGYRGKQIDLLLSDVGMPKMGGKELAEKLRTNMPHIGVILFSGYPAETTNRQGMLDSGIAFLEKPFSPAVLLRKTREVLDRKQRNIS
jgi:CheY-like chemotaxis protein